VRGVTSVDNNLEVRLPPAYERTDADIAGAATDALNWNTEVPVGVSATADKGRLMLTGEVDYHYQRQAAYDSVRWLIGVTSVNNQIRIRQQATSADVKSRIEQAMVRSAELDADNIHVETSDGIVRLTGTVHSWSERDEASRSAWAAPGVHDVHNELTVSD
jgi:osmotically-inducible protein OsmY